MKADVYTQNGKKQGSVALPARVFDAAWNADLVHQVVVGMQANARTSVAHTKDRSDVRGGGKKPWKQKGLGRARHGSSRSPIWRGGGVTFGPRNERNFTKKINKKMRAQALYSVLSKKLKDGEVLFVDSLAFATPKTTDAKAVLKDLAGVKGFEQLETKKHNNVLFALAEKNEAAQKSFNNFGNVKVGETRNLNPVDALTYKHLVIVSPEESVATLLARMEKAEAKATVETA